MVETISQVAAALNVNDGQKRPPLQWGGVRGTLDIVIKHDVEGAWLSRAIAPTLLQETPFPEGVGIVII